MSSRSKSDKWLLIHWTSGGHDVVHAKSMISHTNEVKVGTVVIASKGDGSHEAATIVSTSRDRQHLERQISPNPEAPAEEEAAGPSNNEEPEDFEASASSWAPSDDNPSTDDEQVAEKKIKLERISRPYSNRRKSKVQKPTHRVEAINVLFERSRKRTKGNMDSNRKTKTRITDKKALPDSTKKNNSPAPNPKSDIVSIDVRDIMDMKQCFHELFNILKEIKGSITNKQSNGPLQNNVINFNESTHAKTPQVKRELNNTLNNANEQYESDVSEESRIEEDLNRSDDNVLITNKYDNANNKILTENNSSLNQLECIEDDSNQKISKEKKKHNTFERKNNQNDKDTYGNLPEWIPIGSGKTLIHKEQYRKIKWKSYTWATRTLLLAVFPRKILATHSLTGKKSPAFTNKPAKMCLDPKIVSDVIIEICDRFKVKENLVRSIITTKCADECKMYKTRLQQMQSRKTLPAKDEDVETNQYDEANQTC